MNVFSVPIKSKEVVLALGPESVGNFSIYLKGKIYFSKNFGDLLDNKNFQKFKKTVLQHLKKNKIDPGVVLTDLHPLYKTTVLGNKLARKFKAKHVKIQHHLAHIFSAIGENMTQANNYKLPTTALGIACDGTGYGLDEKIWGGEIFRIKDRKRIGHLENQVMIGGDLAVNEPARMLLSILNNFLEKDGVSKYLKKYYTKNQFELLYNQLQQKFNCQETSSTGRVLDAASVLLGFSKNKRSYKHGPIDLLEKNSTIPYKIKPGIKNNIIQTTPLFKYLIKNIHKDKKRLAATAQQYIVDGLYGITKKTNPKNIYFAGGMANNKIISSYLEFKGVITNKKIPRGDAGLSFGQTTYYLLANSGD
ncbi:hydrogenase maturation protein hypF1 [bacterium BMS3Abin15]|nr:hydrogenase maturation protein hypF1 [bacterium BMS3Abin15]HDZ85965.1 hypothetical protein [Candidatus Moranbacteria bacterium]